MLLYYKNLIDFEGKISFNLKGSTRSHRTRQRVKIPQEKFWDCFISEPTTVNKTTFSDAENGRDTGSSVTKPEKPLIHSSIFFVKESMSDPNKIINTSQCSGSIEVPIRGHENGKLYIKKNPEKTPPWFFHLFSEEVDAEEIGKTSSVSAAFLIKVGDRYFVLSFGQGGRFLINDEFCEERFGLIVALNSVDKDSFRCVDKDSLDSIQSHTRIQSSKETSADQFGLDVEQDILRAITGVPSDPTFGNRITGAESLSVSVNVNLAALPRLLRSYQTAFEDTSYEVDYPWVNNISELKKKSSSLIAVLDSLLVEKLRAPAPENLWVSIPEIIEWDKVKGFIYSSDGQRIHPNINLRGFLGTIPDKNQIDLALLQARKVWGADADHQKVSRPWSIYKCIYAEIDYDDRRYILSGGKWFNIDFEFEKRTKEQFKQLDVSSLVMPKYMDDNEGAYNKRVAGENPEKFALMDKKNIRLHGGARSPVEFCDLFSCNKEIIHIKRYGQSSVFSHLFAQGYVSGRLFLTENEFRQKVVDELPPSFRGLINGRPKESEFTVVFGIISDSESAELHFPFFSMVNLNNVAKTLNGFGYRVELLKIPEDRMHSLIKIAPPGKERRITHRQRKLYPSTPFA